MEVNPKVNVRLILYIKIDSINVSYNDTSKHDVTSLSTSQANTKRYDSSKQFQSGVKSIIPKQIRSNDSSKITKPINFITNVCKFFIIVPFV